MVKEYVWVEQVDHDPTVILTQKNAIKDHENYIMGTNRIIITLEE